MLKPIITKEGNVRYIEVVKYSVLIALIIAGYSTIITVGFIPVLFGGLKLSSVFVVIFIFNVSILSLIEIISLLRLLVKPIIKFITTSLVVTIKEVIQHFESFIGTTTNIQSELSVYRC